MIETSSKATLGALSPSRSGRLSPERKQWTAMETQKLAFKNWKEREKSKENMLEKRRESDMLLERTRTERYQRWLKKTKSSPFAVDLLTEDEKIREESTIRFKEDEERRKNAEIRKEKIKNDIILKVGNLVLVRKYYVRF